MDRRALSRYLLLRGSRQLVPQNSMNLVTTCMQPGKLHLTPNPHTETRLGLRSHPSQPAGLKRCPAHHLGWPPSSPS